MTVACDRLLRSKEPISDIGQALGYDSQSAFGLAFKRVMGCSPGQYGRGYSSARANGHVRE
jgi:AraC-like DNA-binding protein